jgi:hypothetical protein
MQEYNTEIVYLFEGGIETIEIQDIEEILRDPRTRNQPCPTQIDSSHLVKFATKEG